MIHEALPKAERKQRRVVGRSVCAHGEYAASFFSLPKVLANWGNLRLFMEVKPSDLIRLISEMLSRPVLSWLAAPQNVDKFMVLPIATRTFCNTVTSAEVGGGNYGHQEWMILLQWPLCRMTGGQQFLSPASKDTCKLPVPQNGHL